MSSYATQSLIAAHQAACGVSGETFAYVRSGQTLVSGVVGLPGRTTAETFDKLGLATNVELQDWIVLQERLSVGNVPIYPERGDVIEMTSQGLTLRFAVTHPNERQPPWRRCDAWGVLIRIHSLLIDNPVPEEEPEPDPAPESDPEDE